MAALLDVVFRSFWTFCGTMILLWIGVHLLLAVAAIIVAIRGGSVRWRS